MAQKPTIPEIPLTVPLEVRVPESAHRFVKVEAAKAGQTMGEYLLTLLTKFTPYQPPAAAKSDEHSRKS